MKLIFTILIPALLLFTCSCNRKVQVAIQHTTKHIDSSSVGIDTSKYSESTIEQYTTYYGDTLNGTVNIVTEQLADANGFISNDTLESNGIKIGIALRPTKTGFKANLTAIAKPVAITNTKQSEAAVKKGTASNVHVESDEEIKQKGKLIEQRNLSIIFIGIGVSLLFLLILYGIYRAIKNRRNNGN